MMPLLPPHLVLWGSPLYGELYLGLCRALAGPWLGGAYATGGTFRSEAKSDAGQRLAPPEGWQLHDSRRTGEPIGAASLAELCRTVHGARIQNGISSSRSS